MLETAVKWGFMPPYAYTCPKNLLHLPENCATLVRNNCYISPKKYIRSFCLFRCVEK